MNKIVEAVIRNGNQRVPVGLVSIKQALEMTKNAGLRYGQVESSRFEFSHPEYEAGKTDIFVSREALSKLM